MSLINLNQRYPLNEAYFRLALINTSFISDISILQFTISELFISGKFKDLQGTITVKDSKGEFHFTQVLKTTSKKKKSAKKTVSN